MKTLLVNYRLGISMLIAKHFSKFAVLFLFLAFLLMGMRQQSCAQSLVNWEPGECSVTSCRINDQKSWTVATLPENNSVIGRIEFTASVRTSDPRKVRLSSVFPNVSATWANTSTPDEYLVKIVASSGSTCAGVTDVWVTFEKPVLEDEVFDLQLDGIVQVDIIVNMLNSGNGGTPSNTPENDPMQVIEDEPLPTLTNGAWTQVAIVSAEGKVLRNVAGYPKIKVAEAWEGLPQGTYLVRCTAPDGQTKVFRCLKQ